MIFEWMSDPSAWVGLATLIVLEIVLGIDNLVFIAILAEKLPPEQRTKARIVGLILAFGNASYPLSFNCLGRDTHPTTFPYF